MTAAMLAGGGMVWCVGMPDPMEDGRRLSDPVEAVFRVPALPESSPAMSIIDVLPESPLDHPLTAWLQENFRHTTLEDHLDLFVPQPDHLTSHPFHARREPGAEALAPMVLPAAKSE